MEKGSSSSSSKKLSLINEYLQSTQEQLRSVKYPNNITRLKVLQRAFINECIKDTEIYPDCSKFNIVMKKQS